MRWLKGIVIAATIVSALVSRAAAQDLNGSIKGYVTDESGGVLPGVTVTITGPALMGRRTAVTDGEGFYRLLDLPPGEYALTADLMGFQKYGRPNIRVRAGVTLGLDFAMKVGGISETVEVVADAPILEAQKAERGFNVDGDFVRQLPLSPGHDWWDTLKLIPGVLILGGEGGVAETHGGGLSSNAFHLDGVNVADVQQNYAGGTQIPVDSVADLKVTTSGQDAASPMAVGATMRIVTKSGGNEIKGSFTSDMQPKRFNDSNIPGGTPADQTIYQYSGTIGGPVARDRLWYFGSYRYIKQTNGISRSASDLATMRLFVPGFVPFSVHNPTHQLMAKASYQASKSDQLTLTYQYNRTMTRNNGNVAYWTQERALGQYSGGPMYGGTWRRIFGQRATLEVAGGGFGKPFEVMPQGEGPNTRIYRTATVSSGRMTGSGTPIVDGGNVQSVNRSEQRRANVKADFSYFATFRGSHEAQAGFSAERTEYTFINTASNNGFTIEDFVLLDANNLTGGYRTFHRQYIDPIKLPGTGKKSKAMGFYVQDTWRPDKRFVVSLGFRMDRAQTYDTWGDPTQDSWQGGPRLGVTYRLTADGRNIVRASYNRMYDAINNLYAFSQGNLTRGTRDEYDIDGDGTFESVFTTPAVLERPAIRTGTAYSRTSDDLKQPRTDEYTVGFSRQLPWRMALDASGIFRAYKDRMIAVDTNGIYEGGKFLGYNDVNYNQIYEVRNSDANWFSYKALQISLSKNLSHRTQFLVGYSYATMTVDGTWDQNDPASFLQPNAFPNKGGIGRTVYVVSSGVNSYTPTYNTGTPPHNLKMNATWEGPWAVTVAASYLYQMGQYSGPILTLIPAADVPFPTTVTLSNGRVVSNPLATRTRFYYSTRAEGQERAPSLNVVNLSIGKRFRYGRHTLQAAVQAFNLLNRGEFLYFNYPTISQGVPMKLTLYGAQNPRAGQVTLRWEF
ncbi:MAG: carboxypeptidase regulatory-like domain-containing protein [Vicinamibacterales bacterium]